MIYDSIKNDLFSNEAICNGLTKAMHESSGIFHGLELEYIINGQRSARRQVEITGQSIMGGQLYANLRNMPNAPNGGERFLSSEDVKSMVYESTKRVVASVVSDSDYVDASDDVSVSDLIKRELTRDEVQSQRLSPHMWDSVFWDPLWARPDKLTSYLNAILTKDTVGNDTFILTDRENAQVKDMGFLFKD